MEFMFVVLIQDDDLEPEDQDYEFPACFIVDAPNKDMALSWGNDLTMEHCLSNPSHKLLNTTIESINNYPEHTLAILPKVKYDIQVSEDKIGW